MMILSALVFLLILSVLVLIHEAGHYFVAKKFGIKVEEFGFGFPLTPPIWQTKKGETVYSLYPVLIGGFVKLYGEDEAGGGKVASGNEAATSAKAKDLHRAFFSRPLWQRTLVILAGVAMNALLAAVIYYVFLGVSGFKTELPLIGQHTFVGVNQKVNTQVIVSDIAKGSPAEQAGIKEFAHIMSLNGQSVNNLTTFSKTVKANAGKSLTITWVDDKTMKKYTASLIPRLNPPKGQGAMGVAFFPEETVVLSYDTPRQKLFSGFVHPYNLMSYNFDTIKWLINVSVKEKNVAPVSQGVSGPVGIYSLVGRIVAIPDVRDRVLQLLNLAGLLSVSLAFFNVLPIPGLDGGRLFFILLEAVIGGKINPKIEGRIHAVGMAVLLSLLFLVTLKDIAQIFWK